MYSAGSRPDTGLPDGEDYQQLSHPPPSRLDELMVWCQLYTLDATEYFWNRDPRSDLQPCYDCVTHTQQEPWDAAHPLVATKPPKCIPQRTCRLFSRTPTRKIS